MREVDIIIPHYSIGESLNLCTYCLRSIKRHTRNYRLIFIDNGGPLGSGRMDTELKDHNDVVVFRNTANLGFVKAVNQGFAISNAPHVIVMNNDAEANEQWIEMLRKPLRGNVAMSGPRTTTPKSWQGREGLTKGYMLIPRPGMLAFFCTMFRRDLLDKVGFLDEDFGVGLGDDDNYCARAQAAGFDLIFVAELLIRHNHRTTFKQIYTDAEITQMQVDAGNLHREKMKGLL